METPKLPEVWKDIRGHEGRFMISNHGRVKSLNGRYKVSMPDGYISYGCVDTLGYRVYVFRNKKENTQRLRIHSVVATYFCHKPESKEKLCVNHIDGNRQNNYFMNLEWVTHRENLRHAIIIGLWDSKGEKHLRSKLTNEKVIEMRRLRKEDGLTHEKIASMFGICRRQAGDVINGVNWGWLKDGL